MLKSARVRAFARSPRRTMIFGFVVGCIALALATADWAAAQKAASAQKQPGVPTTKAERAVLMDAESGAVIFQHNADVPAPPASMSKLMTLAVVFRAIKAGEISLDDEVKISVNAWRRGGAPSRTSAMFIPVNTKEKLETLLQGIVVQSANDAAIAVAEAIAGNEDNFARLMVDEARRIGLRQATFGNATGLPHPQQQMTARELAELARYLMREYPEHYARFGQKELVFRKYKFPNRNPLLGIAGVDGLKTGSLKEAGFGVVASGNQDGRRLILVVAGLEKKEEVRTEGQKLLEWGFTAVTDVRLFEPDEIVASARVWGGDRMWLPLKGNGAISIVMPKYPPNQKLKAEIIYKRPLKTPIAKGDKVATLRVTSSSNAVSEVPLFAAEDVRAGGLVRRGIDTIVHHALGWAL
ncbi:MAG: D-alanyl-D-alanine carboxypeptidase family protein [Hyphomicrobiaceae bacterium]|nr:D-alanyl-D-alanine carboxypeptidase family protein [Hyphomicrobiaceae bacterium]